MSEDDVRRRVDALLGQMTLEEKIGQLNQLFMFTPLQAGGLEERVRKGEIGSFLFVTDPKVVNRMQRAAVEGSRLKIPLLFGFDVIHGFRTIFPTPLAMAASWDMGLIEQAHTVAAREASAVGIRWTFAPMVDIARDPRWGRIIEGAGEDPVLGAAVAAAQVRGFQGDDYGAADRVIAGPKHFAGYGAALGGRDYDEVLKEAQAKGYAEFDPTADVEGLDALNKLVILVRLAFGAWIDPSSVHNRPGATTGGDGMPGITGVTADDVRALGDEGRVLRLIATTRLAEDGAIEASVVPTAVPADSPFSAPSSTDDAAGTVTSVEVEPTVRVTSTAEAPVLTSAPDRAPVAPAAVVTASRFSARTSPSVTRMAS